MTNHVPAAPAATLTILDFQRGGISPPPCCDVQLKNRARLTSRFPMTETSATTNTFSGHPHPSAMRFFCASMKGTRQFNGGLREPNTTPSGNKFRRLNAVVEARHLTKVAINETKRSGDFYV